MEWVSVLLRPLIPVHYCSCLLAQPITERDVFPRGVPDRSSKIDCSLFQSPPLSWISWKFIHNFSSNSASNSTNENTVKQRQKRYRLGGGNRCAQSSLVYCCVLTAAVGLAITTTISEAGLWWLVISPLNSCRRTNNGQIDHCLSKI